MRKKKKNMSREHNGKKITMISCKSSLQRRNRWLEGRKDSLIRMIEMQIWKKIKIIRSIRRHHLGSIYGSEFDRSIIQLSQAAGPTWDATSGLHLCRTTMNAPNGWMDAISHVSNSQI